MYFTRIRYLTDEGCQFLQTEAHYRAFRPTKVDLGGCTQLSLSTIFRILQNNENLRELSLAGCCKKNWAKYGMEVSELAQLNSIFRNLHTLNIAGTNSCQWCQSSNDLHRRLQSRGPATCGSSFWGMHPFSLIKHFRISEATSESKKENLNLLSNQLTWSNLNSQTLMRVAACCPNLQELRYYISAPQVS